MDAFVFAAVLFAAACHAAWNAAIKRGLDPLATTVVISVGAALVAAAFLPLVGVPAAASWPWCAASVLIHLFYFAALIESYRAGDLGHLHQPWVERTLSARNTEEALAPATWGRSIRSRAAQRR